MYTLTFQDQPLATDALWQNIADIALANGLAIRVFGCIFQLLPGVTIK